MLLPLLLGLSLPNSTLPLVQRPFEIDVVDAQTGRGIPLVQLETVNHIRYVTDSAGRVAFDEPGLMAGKVFFFVSSDGYSFPRDGFGYAGLALSVVPGGTATIRMTRENIAERLCRLTGEGIYRDSVLLGKPVPLASPVLDGGVLGQDTAQAELYRGRMMWFWGDTDRARYPLGNFHTSGAIATLPKGVTDARYGLDFHYFTGADGFVRPMVPSNDTHPIWVSGLVVLDDGLFAYYAQMVRLGQIASSGLLKWNDRTEQFDIVQTFAPDRGWRFLDGHTVQADGFVLGNDPPNVRVPADAAKLRDPGAYEAFTCLNADGSVRRIDGHPSYRWQRDLPPITSAIEARLAREGKLTQDEAHFLPRDSAGNPVEIANGSVHWNAFRRRWIGIFGQKHGTSELGEIWYAEADTPTGPFKTAVKIVTHRRYTFYNPVHHAFLDTNAGRTIFFEATYTAEFSGNPDKTPRYNYNQILYKLDLSDPRLQFARGTPTHETKSQTIGLRAPPTPDALLRTESASSSLDSKSST